MLDRLLSAAGAIADIADRIVQSFFRFGRFGPIVAIGLVGFGSVVMLGLGLEATDNPEPRTITPAQIAGNADLGRRTYSTISGDLVRTYIETYEDDNDNGEHGANERARNWFYWIVDPETRAGVTVRSRRSPDEMFHFETSGVVYRDAEYVKEDAEELKDYIAEAGVELDPAVVIDATAGLGASDPVAYDWASPPVDETVVKVGGTHLGDLATCLDDPNDNGQCDDAELNASDVVIYDPATKHAVVVVTQAQQDTLPMTLTGMLRRDTKAVNDAQTPEDPRFKFADLEINVSDQYLLEEGGKPLSAPLAYASAVALAVFALVVLIGWRIGYVVYRRDERPLPSRARSMAIGERVPIHVTGGLVGGKGRFRVREASAELVRIALEAPTPTSTPDAASATPPVPNQLASRPRPVIRPDGTIGEAEPAEPLATVEPKGEAEPASPTESVDTPSTLIVDRAKGAAGQFVGSGAVKGMSVGRVVPLRGPRPAIRLATDAGRLTLSFNSVAERDKAVAELLDDNDLSGGLSGRAGAIEA
jgi:hypothetical protein